MQIYSGIINIFPVIGEVLIDNEVFAVTLLTSRSIDSVFQNAHRNMFMYMCLTVYRGGYMRIFMSVCVSNIIEKDILRTIP